MANRSLYRINLTGDGQTIAATGNIYRSPAINMRPTLAIQALLLRQSSAAFANTSDLKIDVEYTHQGENIDPPDWSSNVLAFIASTATALAAATDKQDWISLPWTITFEPGMQIRLKFNGIGSNPPDTLLDAKLVVQEQH